MQIKKAFGKSLKQLRHAKAATQEDFSVISSRTYISQLERGQKNPTLEKSEAFARVLNVHPLSLLCLTYLHAGGQRDLESLFRRIRTDLKDISR